MISTAPSPRPSALPGAAWWFLDCLMVELPTPGPGSPVVSEATLPSGASPPLHVHGRLDDSFYVLEGLMVVRCGDQVSVATRGAWVPFPRGVPHTFRVMGGPARILQVHGDDSFLRLVRALGTPAAKAELPAPTGGAGIEALDRAFADHDITNVGPAMSEDEAQRVLLAGAP